MIQKRSVTIGSVLSAKSTGKPQTLDKTERGNIVRVSLANPKLTASRKRREWSFHNKFSIDTVHGVLRQNNLHLSILHRKSITKQKTTLE